MKKEYYILKSYTKKHPLAKQHKQNSVLFQLNLNFYLTCGRL